MPIYIVQGIQEIPPVFVVEAETEEEAIEKAWRGEELDDLRGTDNADSVRNVKRKSWTAERA